MSDLTATELASRLSVSRRHAVDLLADGAITGRKLSSGAWLADADSVLRYEASARRGGGRDRGDRHSGLHLSCLQSRASRHGCVTFA